MTSLTIDRFQYCLAQLKRYDHDRYLAVLLAPADLRPKLAALYAFEVELERVPHTVSEPMLGEIRFQWWRDVLESLTPASRPGHEVAEALAETLFDTDLDPAGLLPLVDVHADRLTAEPSATLDAWVAEARRAATTSLQARLALLNCGDAENDAMLSLEVAAQMARLLRSLPFYAGAQHLILPLDLMGEHDVDPHDVFQGVARPGLKALIGDLLQEAERHYIAGEKLDVSSPALLHGLLPTALTSLYVKRMRARSFDPLRHNSDVPAFRRQLRLLRVLWSKRF